MPSPLTHKYNSESFYFLPSSVAGSSTSSSFIPNFPNCSSPRMSASVYADYLRSHFSVSQLESLRSRARGYRSKLRLATCPELSHSSFCSPFSSIEIFAAASILSGFTASVPNKIAYPMVMYPPRSRMDFLHHIFNLPWALYSFSSIWKTSSIIPIQEMGKPLDSPRPSNLSFSPSAHQSFQNASFYLIYSSF